MHFNERQRFIRNIIGSLDNARFENIADSCGYYAVGIQGQARLRRVLDHMIEHQYLICDNGVYRLREH